MIIGSGLLAKAFASHFLNREDVCIYAAGVSNSSCTNANEFARERQRVLDAIELAKGLNTLVYFGTCSATDPELRHMPYVRHKLAMEELISTHHHHLIFRLPQVAGITPNPHTLLNFLYARIVRSESFSLWNKAGRNVIDVDDVAFLGRQLIDNNAARNGTFNIANPVTYTMIEIVKAMERVVGKSAVYDIVDRGSKYTIDIAAIRPWLEKANGKFGDDYLERVIAKYYEKIN